MASLNMSGSITKSLLVITGAMGAGKTSVVGEASDILTLHYIAHAAIDVDTLGLAYLPTASGNDDVMYGNLRSVCDNYASLGKPLRSSVSARRSVDTRKVARLFPPNFVLLLRFSPS